MAAFSTIAAAIGLGLAAGGTAYGVVKAEESAGKAEAQVVDQNKKQAELEAQAKAQADDEKKQQAAIAERDRVRQAAASREQSMGRANSGRQGTILTSPLGTTGVYQKSQKTLLGQ